MKSNVMYIQENRVMKLKFILGLLALCIVARSYADTLCNSNEQIVFSCTVAHHKMASLCAPKDLKAPGLYLQYRFGTHQNIELTYPDKKDDPQHSFSMRAQPGGLGLLGDYITFMIGSYNYYVYAQYSSSMSDDTERDGVAVYRQDRLIRNLKCGEGAVSRLHLMVTSHPDLDPRPLKMPQDLDWEEMPGKASVLLQFADSDGVSLSNADPYKIFRADSVVADSRGFLWVNSGNYISKLMPDGNVMIYAGKPYNDSSGSVCGFRDGDGKSALFGSFNDFVLDKHGNIYVLDRCSDVIRKVAPDGNVSTIAGIRGLAGLQDGPLGVATIWPGKMIANDAGDLFILSEKDRHVVIRKIDKNGAISTVVSKITLMIDGKLISVDGLAGLLANSLTIDSKGNFYIACHAGGGGDPTAIMKINTLGFALIVAGDFRTKVSQYVDGNVKNARFGSIGGMVIDKEDNIFVADSMNHSVRKITPQGVVSTFLDLNQIPGMRISSEDFARILKNEGPYGAGSWGRSPETLALDDQHNLYITASFDYSNHYLFKVTPGGQVITLWSVTGPNKAVYFRHGSE